jgi:hypothetical protein
MGEQSAMTIDDVIEDFGDSRCMIARGSMRWALNNWDVAAPRLLEMLWRSVDGSFRTEQTQLALAVIIHLLGEKAETAAFRDLCRWLRDQDVVELILADAVTATLSRLLISQFDGDVRTLHAVIEALDAVERLSVRHRDQRRQRRRQWHGQRRQLRCDQYRNGRERAISSSTAQG